MTDSPVTKKPRQKRDNLTAAELRQILHYDPDTGVFRWRITLSRRNKAGNIAGSVDIKTGYRRIGIRGIHYYAHRLAHLYMTSKWPPEFVDHKFHNTDDNRWEMIRLATEPQNHRNARISKRNTSGAKGVSEYVLANGRIVYRTTIYIDRKSTYLGTFSNVRDAAHAYEEAAKKAFGEFAHYTRP